MVQYTITPTKEKPDLTPEDSVTVSVSSPSAGSKALLIPPITQQPQVLVEPVEPAPIPRRGRMRRFRDGHDRRMRIACCLLVICAVTFVVGCVMGVISDLHLFKGIGWHSGYTSRIFGSQEKADPAQDQAATYHRHANGKLGDTIATTDHCVQKRHLDRSNTDVVIDTKSRWSALVQHNHKRCLLFHPLGDMIPVCEKAYPWRAELAMGTISCRLPIWRLALPWFNGGPIIKRVSRLIKVKAFQNMNETGDAISEECEDYGSHEVATVVVSYYRLGGRASRSVDAETTVESPPSPSASPPPSPSLSSPPPPAADKDDDDDDEMKKSYYVWDKNAHDEGYQWDTTVFDKEGKTIEEDSHSVGEDNPKV